DPNSTAYNAITVQPDGKIVGVGSTSNSQFVNRLLENGSPDLSFGTNGFELFGSRYEGFSACKIEQDGKIVIGGGYTDVLVPEQFILKRFKTNGALDSTFGSAGTTVTKVGSYDSYITDLALQSDGKIVALGSTDNYTASANTRYNTDGTLDNTFANGGIAHNFFPGIFGSAVSLLVQDDNKILLGGGVYIEKGIYALERLTANGLIDSSFGVNGETTTDFADYSGSSIASIGLQSSGKIVAIGTSSNIGDYKVSLARYNNDLTQKQILIAKIRHWLQHHNGFTWDNNSNISSYVIQRSYDGINWSTVHSQQTTINSQPSIVNSQLSTVNYYNDPSPLSSTNYYRLQTTSVSGAVNYSNVIAVTNDDVKISPNPATNSLHIECLSSNQKTKLIVVDFAGNIKLQTSVNNSSYSLNIASLTTGNYLLKIEMNGEVITKKFVKE
ncbi:MAG TPA: T9SS type A sorting domain-containing protein, partial [Parafilimonas sp.]